MLSVEEDGNCLPNAFIVGMLDNKPVTQEWLEQNARQIVELLPGESRTFEQRPKPPEPQPQPEQKSGGDQVRDVVARIKARCAAGAVSPGGGEPPKEAEDDIPSRPRQTAQRTGLTARDFAPVTERGDQASEESAIGFQA